MDPTTLRPVEPHWRVTLKRLAGPIVAGAIAIAKWSFLLLKFGSIFIAVGAYALLGGWTFAIGFVLMILVHELGHYIEAKREGLKPKLPVFIPFLAAYVAYTRGNPWQTARVAIAGPIFGGLASLALLFVANARGSATLHYVAYWGFLLNLMNMAPFWIFDGAAVMRSAGYLRKGGGSGKATFIYCLYAATAVALVIGMIAAHVSQDRL